MGKETLKLEENAQPSEVLNQLVNVFLDKGWLNQILRIRYHDKKYRLLCNTKTFIAYRINKNYEDRKSVV